MLTVDSGDYIFNIFCGADLRERELEGLTQFRSWLREEGKDRQLEPGLTDHHYMDLRYLVTSKWDN